MNQELVKHDSSGGGLIRPADRLTDIQRLGGLLSASGYFSDAREMAQAAVKVMAGEELGIPPIASMMGINIIKGKVALSGNLIASRIRAHGYDYKNLKMEADGCILEFFSKPGPDGKRSSLGKSAFAESDAKAAGLLGSDMYKKYPRNMYFNRAMSNGARWYTPEVFAGAPVYTPEELGAIVDEEGNVVAVEAAGETREQLVERRIAEEKAKAEAPKPTPANISSAAKAEGKSPFKAMLDLFSKAKANIGDSEYKRILGVHGFEHANEVPNLTAGDRILAEMRQAYQDRKAAPAPKYEASDDDLPQALAAQEVA